MVATEFDPIKAIREEIAGLQDVEKALSVRERFAEQQLGQAESELNALRKLTGYTRSELDRKNKVLQQLIKEKESAEKEGG